LKNKPKLPSQEGRTVMGYCYESDFDETKAECGVQNHAAIAGAAKYPLGKAWDGSAPA